MDGRMEAPEENLTMKEMLEKMAELEYSRSQLRELNTKMRHWLDVADNEMTALRSENTVLKSQVKNLERVISEAQQDEAEPNSSLLNDDLNAKRCDGKEIQALEKEANTIKEENKNLTAQFKILQQERDQDKISLRKFRVSLHTLEWEIEETRFELQRRDETIHQKDLKLQHTEETVEECSNIIKDLRLTNRELREQLEHRENEAVISSLNDMKAEKAGTPRPTLSFAEEVKLLASSAEDSTDSSYSTDEEPEALQLLESPSLTGASSLQTKGCAGASERSVHRAAVLVLFIFILILFTYVMSAGLALVSDLLLTLRSSSLLMSPYCSLHYRDLPPI